MVLLRFEVKSFYRTCFHMIILISSSMPVFLRFLGAGVQGWSLPSRLRMGISLIERILTKIQKMTNEVELWDEVYRTLDRIYCEPFGKGGEGLKER